MTILGRAPAPNALERRLLLALLTLALIALALRPPWNGWPTTGPAALALAITLILACGLILTAFERENQGASAAYALAGLGLVVVMAWAWRPAVDGLLALLGPLVGLYALSCAADAGYRALRAGSGVGVRPILLVGALPVLLIAGCYLAFGAAAALDPRQIGALFAVGVALTYANLGAAISGGGRPVDAGIRLPDGKRLLGDGKTWRGLIGGLVIATAAGFIAGLPASTSALVAGTALLGDAGASFLKRRAGLEQGDPVPFLDQLDGLLPLLWLATWPGLMGLGSLAAPGAAPVLLLATLFIQALGNRLLHCLAMKAVPW